MTINCNLPHAWNPAKYFYDQANIETLHIGATLPSKKSIASPVKIGTYRLLSVPTGLVATVAALGCTIINATLVTFTLGRNQTCRQWMVICAKGTRESLTLTIKSIGELYYLAVALLKGHYLRSAIFPQDVMLHTYDGERIEEVYAMQKTNLVYRHHPTTVRFHRELFEASTSEPLQNLVADENLTSAFTTLDLSTKALIAFRRFLYRGFTTLELDVLIELLAFANKTDLPALNKQCANMLHYYVDDKHLALLLKTSQEETTQSESLQNQCFEYIRQYPCPAYTDLINTLGIKSEYDAYTKKPPTSSISTCDVYPDLNMGKIGDVIFECKNQNLEADQLVLGMHSSELRNVFINKRDTGQIKFDEDGSAYFDASDYTADVVKAVLMCIYQPSLAHKFELNDERLNQWKDIFEFVPKFPFLRGLKSDLACKFERRVLSAFSKATAEQIEQAMGNRVIQELETLGNDVGSSIVASLCMQAKIGNYINGLENYVRDEDLSTLNNLFDKDRYPLVTKLNLTKYSLSNNQAELNYDLLSLIAAKCPGIQTIELPEGNLTKRQIKELKIFKSCLSLKSIKIGDRLVFTS